MEGPVAGLAAQPSASGQGLAPLPPRGFHRPLLVALIAALMIIGGVLVVIVGILLTVGASLVGAMLAGGAGLLVGAALGVMVLIAGALMLVSGLGLWRMRTWAWWLAMVVLVLDLIGAATVFGKVVIGLLLVYLILVRKHFNQ